MIGRAPTQVVVVVLMLAGCRVDELDLSGKHCPCLAGWICDVPSDTCVRDPAAVDAPIAGDGGGDVDAPSIDAPPGSSCLAGPPGASLFSDGFDDLIGWVTRGGSWAAVASEAVQSSTATTLTYAFPAGTEGFTDYRIRARARALAGSGALELALRIEPGDDGQYHCAWTPSSGALRLQWTRSNGTLGGTLIQTQVAIGSIPGYDPAAPQIIEASAVGDQLACCVRDLAGASITVADTRYVAGAPGLKTSALSAAFDDLAVDGP